MRLIDFLIDVLASGSVIGTGTGDSPEEVTRRLGEDFIEDRRRTRMRRDYGLAEFSWERPRGDDQWHSIGFAVQVHRLAHDVTVTHGLAAPSHPHRERDP